MTFENLYHPFRSMASLPRLNWNTAVEMAPHCLCAAALGAFKGAGGESDSPQWAQAVSVVTAAALLPVCFAAGRQFRPWKARWATVSIMLLNGVFACLAGVSVGLLGVAMFFREWIHWSGVATFDELLWRPMALGGCLGLLAFVLGLGSRR
jgi:hypothetical protein